MMWGKKLTEWDMYDDGKWRGEGKLKGRREDVPASRPTERRR